MGIFLNLTINGVSLAAILFLVSAGLSLIFGLMGVLNFAHGSFVLWGAYSWYAAYINTHSFWLALLVAFLTGAVLGALTERIFMRNLYQRPLSQILVTLGLGLVLQQLVVAIWGQIPEYPGQLPEFSRTFVAGDVSITSFRIFGIGAGLVTLVVVWVLLRFTRIGLIVRAGVENPTMVRALGINVSLVFLGVFALGSALAALGGSLYGNWQFAISTDMGQNVLLLAIIIVVLGGLGSYLGSAVGALIIGLAQEYVPYYASQVPHLDPSVQTSAASLVSLAILVVILLVRPTGLMGINVEPGEH
ncbi:MAG TPA: branched-chain amino acid ABC transporter permease [Chloroflexota bacterium]